MTLFLSTVLLAFLRPRLSYSLLIPTYQSTKTSTTRTLMSTTGSASASKVHRILCYGDSLTAGTADSMWDLYPYAPHLEQALNAQKSDASKSYVVRHRGMPGWTASAMVDAADDSQCGLRSAIRGIQNPSLSCVIILAGTNDLGYAAGVPPEQQVSTILTPVKSLHEMAWNEGIPRTIAVAIPPSGYQASVSEAASLARQVNQELETFCQSSGGKGVFVEFPFGYQAGGENWSPDGLHFSPKGYAVLGNYLADPLLQVLNGLDA